MWVFHEISVRMCWYFIWLCPHRFGIFSVYRWKHSLPDNKLQAVFQICTFNIILTLLRPFYCQHFFSVFFCLVWYLAPFHLLLLSQCFKWSIFEWIQLLCCKQNRGLKCMCNNGATLRGQIEKLNKSRKWFSEDKKANRVLLHKEGEKDPRWHWSRGQFLWSNKKRWSVNPFTIGNAGVMNRGSSYFTLMGTLGEYIHTQNSALRLC